MCLPIVWLDALSATFLVLFLAFHVHSAKANRPVGSTSTA
jgi:hypothetical protein